MENKDMRYLTTLEPFGLASTAFDRLWSGLGRDALEQTRADSRMPAPAVDVVEAPDAYAIEVELPGVDPATVEITLLDDVLTIKGEKPARPQPQDGERIWARERSVGSFERRFRFPVAVDADRVEAHAEHGVLHVRVHKAPESQPRRIEVKKA
jgi:HSP20 family protein